MQAKEKVCTSKNFQAKQLRSGDQVCTRKSRITQHYTDLYRALCMTWKLCWKGWFYKDGDLLKQAKKPSRVVKLSWPSNQLLSSWEAILRKSRTERSKTATLSWLEVSPLLSRQQVFVRMLSRPKDLMTNSEQTFAGLYEEVQICNKIKLAVLNWNCSERSWRNKFNGKY